MFTPGAGSDLVAHAAVLALALVAAVTDVRKGVIPNWLTLGALVLAPLASGLADGSRGVLASLLGMLVCALAPLVIYYRGGMAGGDVKAFAAIGAIGGYELGLTVQLLALVCASIYAVGYLAWSGRLLASLGNSLRLGLNPVLPRRWRRPMSSALMHRIRLGAAIFLAASIAVAGEHPELWA
jgi:prepilin peptidase CpaA